MQQKKNIAPLICGIIGTVFGLVGGFLWVACSDCAYYGLPLDTIWLLLFILFGLGGPVLGLIGSILAFGYKRAGGALLLIALLFCIGHIAATVAFMAELGLGFSFWLEIFTIFALILYLVATCFGFRKAPAADAAAQRIPYTPPQQPYGQYPPYNPYGQPQQPYYRQQPPQGGQPYGMPPVPPQQGVGPQAPVPPQQQYTQQQPQFGQPQQPQYGQQPPQQPKPQQPWQVQKPQGPNDPDGQG